MAGGGGASESPGGASFQVGELGGLGAAVEESRFVLFWDLPGGVEVGVLKEVFMVSPSICFERKKERKKERREGKS